MERHFPELRALAAVDPEFREWLGDEACPEVQRCEDFPCCGHGQDDHVAIVITYSDFWRGLDLD